MSHAEHDAHAEHGHDAADDAHHDEPPPPPEPETPLWFTLVGALLFVVLGVGVLTFTTDAPPAKAPPAARRAQVALPSAAAPPPQALPPQALPIRRPPPMPTAQQ